MSFPIVPAESANNPKMIRYMDTTAAYDLWSEVYDHDGNFLQALDNIELQSLLPKMLSNVQSPHPWKIVDLGCGTGRNTAKLIGITDATILGLDASPKMLELAVSRLTDLSAKFDGAKEVELEIYDILGSSPPPAIALEADALISTLVLEHIPIPEFFRAILQILKPDGVALVTNMHSDMGAIQSSGICGPDDRRESAADKLCSSIGRCYC